VKREIDVDTLRALLRYEPETGKLYWRERPVEMFEGGLRPEASCKAWNVRFAGKEALTAVNASGYHNGGVFGKIYLAHRVAFAISFGYWPDQIDHINGDRKDNRICNLRDVPNRQNSVNSKLRHTNTSGVSGVSWVKRRKAWIARVSLYGNRFFVGYSKSFEDAVKARKEAEQKYNYDPLHGKSPEVRKARKL
jgi:hypothetical protein